MSTQKYFVIMTDKGLSKLRAAAQGIAPLTLSHMAFGDGGGQETAPSGTASALVNERYRAPIADKKPHPTNPSMLYIEAIIPPGVGGWTLREAGIYDTDGELICIAKTPVMDVALLAEGATTEGLVKLMLTFESIQIVQFFIDPTVLLATQAWVIDRIIHRPFITVESVTLAAPPATPADHALYVVPKNATGAWAGKDFQMAYWHGAWQFAQAPVAKVVGASDTGKYWRHTATGWEEWFSSTAEILAAALSNKPVAPKELASAVQAGSWNSATATGTVNALIVSLSPKLLAYSEFLHVSVRTTGTNTGVTTINIDGLGAKQIVSTIGTPIKGGELPEVAQLVYVGGAFLLLNPRPAFASLLSGNGYIFLNSGLIMQWGRFSGWTTNYQQNGVFESDQQWMTWPITFPNNLLQVVGGSGSDVYGVGMQEQAWFVSANRSGGDARVACRQSGAYLEGSYIAFGY